MLLLMKNLLIHYLSEKKEKVVEFAALWKAGSALT